MLNGFVSSSDVCIYLFRFAMKVLALETLAFHTPFIWSVPINNPLISIFIMIMNERNKKMPSIKRLECMKMSIRLLDVELPDFKCDFIPFD